MLTCALPDFDSDDLVSFQNPAKFWTLFTIYVIAALLLLCSLVFQLPTLWRSPKKTSTKKQSQNKTIWVSVEHVGKQPWQASYNEYMITATRR